MIVHFKKEAGFKRVTLLERSGIYHITSLFTRRSNHDIMMNSYKHVHV